MESPGEPQHPSWSEVRKACICLLEADPEHEHGVLQGLTADALKAAFRRQAKEVHPDRLADASSDKVHDRTNRFIALKQAYEVMQAHMQASERPRLRRGPKGKTVIAVGGAKGGIGKSLFVANLGIFLASQGRKTVVVDLDLGSANLHLYLGEKTLLQTGVHDFLTKRADRLEEVMVRSRYGPWIIGGDSSLLGAANLPFPRKLKLIRAIRALESDVVILDLGGDTTYNILDFFLAADVGIVMTTRDAPSTLSAYHFLKGALYRRLHRLFGPESPFHGLRDEALERTIRTYTGENAAPGRTVGHLVRKVRAEHPEGIRILHKALAGFAPSLLLNKVPAGTDARDVVHKLQAVTARWLSVKLRYLGALSHHPAIEQSTVTMTPVVARFPGGTLAKEMGTLVERIPDLQRS